MGTDKRKALSSSYSLSQHAVKFVFFRRYIKAAINKAKHKKAKILDDDGDKGDVFKESEDRMHSNVYGANTYGHDDYKTVKGATNQDDHRSLHKYRI